MRYIQSITTALILISGFFLSTVTAQSPLKMSYQAVIRDASNNLVASHIVKIKLSALKGSSTGTVAFSESRLTNTNANGLATVQIGGGAVISGSIASINWGDGPYFIKTETDPTGGTNYTITGTSELLSVPYALYAANGGVAGPQGPQGPPGTNGTNGTNGAK